MLILPAVVVGGLVVACLVIYVGYLTTYTILTFFLKRAGKVVTDHYRDSTGKKQAAKGVTENDIGKISFAGGGVALGLAILLLSSIQAEQVLLVGVILTVLGVIFGLLSFAIVGSRHESQAAARPGTGGAAPTPPQPWNGYAKPSDNGHSQPEFMIVVCENCSQKLRIPRQRGKLIITCPKCRASFPYSPGLGGLKGKLKYNYRSIMKKIRSLKIFK